MPDNPEKVKVTCSICGYELPSSDPILMAEHLILNHPFDMLESPKFRQGLFSLAERAGAALADLIRGKKP